MTTPADATPVPGPDTPRWTVDEYETYTLHGPKGTRIRCYQGSGTLPAPWLARDVVAAFRAARVHEGCAHTTNTLQQARQLAVEWKDASPDARLELTHEVMNLLLVDGGGDG